MKSTRQAFGEALLTIDSSHIICLDADLSKSTMTYAFSKKFPERHLQMGLQEANMIGVAAGIANTGKTPIVCSFACFLTGRFDQIRMSIAYNQSPVILVGTHSGIAVGEDGYSQMSLEDIALMRSLPGMRIFQPSQASEVQKILEQAILLKSPVYIRLTRQALKEYSQDINPFKLNKIKEGSCKTALVGSGGTLQEIMEANTNCHIYSLSQIKPLPDLSELESFEKIYIYEDHTIYGGLGSMILDCYPELRSKITVMGIQDVFGESGSTEDLYKKHSLDRGSICKKFIDR